MTSSPLLIDHILFLLFGLILPLNSVFRAQPRLKTLGPWNTRMKIGFYMGNSLSLWALAIVVVLVWYFTGRSLSILGFRLPNPDSTNLSLAIALAFIVAYGVYILTDMWSEKAKLKARKHLKKHTPFLPENTYELRHFSFVALSAGVCEEVLFRGFFITYLLSLFGNSFSAQAAALLIPTIIFAVSHFYQGWKAVAKIALLSLAFGILFIISQSLLVPILLHTFVDLVSGYAGMKIVQTDLPDDRNAPLWMNDLQEEEE